MSQHYIFKHHFPPPPPQIRGHSNVFIRTYGQPFHFCLPCLPLESEYTENDASQHGDRTRENVRSMLVLLSNMTQSALKRQNKNMANPPSTSLRNWQKKKLVD